MARNQTRRWLLTTIGTVGSAAIAGCSGGANPSNSKGTSSNTGPTSTTTADSSDVFTNITVDSEITDRAFIQAEMADDIPVEKVNLLGANGTAAGSKSVDSGQTTVELDIADGISDPLTPGKYELVAVDSGEVIDRKPIKIKRAAKVKDVSIVAPSSGEATSGPPRSFKIELKITGELPIEPESLIAHGDVLNPDDPDGRWLAEPEFKTNKIRVRNQIWPGETVVMEVATAPLITSPRSTTDLRETNTCNGEERTAIIQFRGASGFTKRVETKFVLSGEAVWVGGGSQQACSGGSMKSWETV